MPRYVFHMRLLPFPKCLIDVHVQKGKSGGYVKVGLERMQDRLDGTRPISKELLPIVEQAVKIAISVNAAAVSVEGNNDTSLDEHKPVVKKLVEDLQSIATQCNHRTEQSMTSLDAPSHTVSGRYHSSR